MRIILVLMLSISMNSFGQEIKYNLKVKNPCSKIVEHELLYYLEKSGEEFNIKDTLGTIFLKEIGKYKVVSMVHGIVEDVEIKNGANIDTLYTKKIYECLEPVSHPSFIGYCCCDQKCDGIQKDYYNNGTLRIEGKFRNGKAIGKIKKYYPNGIIEEIKVYNKKGILRRKIKYDSIGDKM